MKVSDFINYIMKIMWRYFKKIRSSRFRDQRAKKVVSDSPGLVDFAIGLVFFVLNLPDGQVLFFGEIQITEGLLSILPIKKGFGASWNDLWASTCYLQLARMAGCKTDFLFSPWALCKKALKVQILNEVALIQVVIKRVSF